MPRDDLLVVGLDLTTGREVHIGDRPLEEWRAAGYRRGETVVCALCWYGDATEPRTRVPLIARGRIGGRVSPHFAHPPGTLPAGGHSAESTWHLTAKHRLARWAASRPTVAAVELERWTPDRKRRADVRVELRSGAVLALEAQSALITDEVWQARHRDYAAVGVRDVWFMRPGTPLPHVLFVEGVHALTLHPDHAAVPLGRPHRKPARWWETDLRPYSTHYPPCPDDPVTWQPVPLDALGLDDHGITPPPDLAERLREEADQTRRRAEQDRRAADRAGPFPRPREPRRPDWTPPPLPPLPPPPPGPPVPGLCRVCGRPLAEALLRAGRHILC